MSHEGASWERRNTPSASDWPLSSLLEIKAGTRVAVVIPARNEAETVGSVVELVVNETRGLVDELVVMDSLSSDDTAARAARAGAVVHSVADVRPDLGVLGGKGEALWKSLFVVTADVLVFIDADLTEWGSHFVTGLLGPLLTTPSVQLVRGFYDRVLDTADGRTLEGGRVTELVARPWIALHRPDLAGVVQPLAGEWAIRRSAFERLSVPVGYGVELSTLLDVHAMFGLEAIAQVDLGRRAHQHQSLHDLAAMATELLAVGDRRLRQDPGQMGGEKVGGASRTVTLCLPQPDRSWDVRPIPIGERPAK